MAVEFDPEKHCGARGKTSGEPCKRPRHWGVPFGRRDENAARGNYRCKLHGGMSTGARTAKGKALSDASRVKHGFFRVTATGADAVNMDAASQYSIGEILDDGARWALAKLRRIQEGDVKLSRGDNMIKLALQVLVEQEDISESRMNDVVMFLSGFTLSDSVSVLSRTAAIANQAIGLDRMGDLKRRCELLEQNFYFTMQRSGERHIKEHGLMTLQLLKTEAGIDTEALAEMQQRLLASQEDEGGVGDEESVDVEVEELETDA